MVNSNTNTLIAQNALTAAWQFNQEILLGFALAIISQTQLRFPGMPFGLGELIIALMIVYHLFIWLKHSLGKSNFKKAVSTNLCAETKWTKLSTYYISGFGFAFIALVLISTFIWLPYYKSVNVSYMEHNVLSYFFVSIAFLFFLKSDLNFKVIALSFTIILLTLLAAEFFIVPSGIYFYENVKLRGLSENPNQLALYLLLCPLFLANCNGYKFLNKYTIAGLIFIIAIGAYFIHSSAYFVAYFSCAGAYIFLLLLKAPCSKRVKLGVIALAIILAIASMFIYLAHISAENNNLPSQSSPFAAQSFAKAVPIKVQANLASSSKSQNIESSTHHTFINFNSEANVRLRLWEQALDTISVSPLVGLGAGVGVLQADTNNLSEVHNTFLDLSVQSGGLGLMLYVLFLTLILIKILQQKNNNMALLMYVTLIAFSMFHFIFRQPIVWFYLAYMLQMHKSKSIR